MGLRSEHELQLIKLLNLNYVDLEPVTGYANVRYRRLRYETPSKIQLFVIAVRSSPTHLCTRFLHACACAQPHVEKVAMDRQRNQLPTNLPQLQNLIKRDGDLYKDEVDISSLLYNYCVCWYNNINILA